MTRKANLEVDRALARADELRDGLIRRFINAAASNRIYFFATGHHHTPIHIYNVVESCPFSYGVWLYVFAAPSDRDAFVANVPGTEVVSAVDLIKKFYYKDGKPTHFIQV